MSVLGLVLGDLFLWSVNKLARAVRNAWRVWSRTFIIHVNTGKIVLWETQHNNADLDCFKDSDFAGDLEDSKSTSGGVLCIFGSHTFVPISWMCKKTDFSFTQFYRSWGNFSRCRFTHGRYSRSHSLGFGDWSISFRTEQNRWTQERAMVKPVGSCWTKLA